MVHNLPELYPAPAEWRPERFLTRSYSPFEYLPFGGGHRRCLGLLHRPQGAFTFADPNLHANLSVHRLGFREAVINVRAQRVQRYLADAVLFMPR